ncbi:MAG: DUF1501 domain-containing protein [Rubrivivax sp.]
MSMNPSRRSFIRAGSALAATLGPRFSMPLAGQLAALGALAGSQVASSATSGYKAVVCLFMNGGNDSHNWLVPLDSTNYASYKTARGELALASSALNAITSSSQGSGRQFGMPAEMAPLRTWYENGRAAWLANVGPLVRPVTKAEFQAGVGLPSKLFSHNDQQATWQSLEPEGAPSGWGGRMGDLLMAANQNPVVTAISTNGNTAFLTGTKVSQYQVSANGVTQMNAALPGWRAGSSATPAALQGLLASSTTDTLQAEYLKVVQRALATSTQLAAAVAATSVPALPTTPVALPNGSTLNLANDVLAKQLRVVASLVAAGPGLGMQRQVFMVSVGGFDTHSNQLRDQSLLMSRVAHSVDWFLNALQAQGQLDNVVLFSASDFGRTLASNGDGSDHGWGGHHFVAGGSVKGREIHGTMPVTALGTADDVGSGRLLPSTSVTELAASLGRWMGLSDSELLGVLPNLGSFSAGRLALL